MNIFVLLSLALLSSAMSPDQIVFLCLYLCTVLSFSIAIHLQQYLHLHHNVIYDNYIIMNHENLPSSYNGNSTSGKMNKLVILFGMGITSTDNMLAIALVLWILKYTAQYKKYAINYRQYLTDNREINVLFQLK